MGLPRGGLIVAVAACLAWAAVEARHLNGGVPRPDPCRTRWVDPSLVEASYAPIVADREAGLQEEALLALRTRTREGPYPGYAWFLLGEMSYREEAFAAAVRHYRKAVAADPSLADAGAAFSAAERISTRLEELRQGPWADSPPPEIRDLHYLRRRLAGGCE